MLYPSLIQFCALGWDLALLSHMVVFWLPYSSIFIYSTTCIWPPTYVIGVFCRHKERICSNGSCDHRCCMLFRFFIIVKSLPGGWSFYTLVSGTHYITCYLGNITGEERYEQHSYMLPR